MANPKRKTSKQRKRIRRTHLGLEPINLSLCPQCNQARPAHRVCSNCGHYGGKKVVDMEEI